ncbi:MAG: 50S ribosomal protein L35ae [Candidatus Woesearchaeota archaeon]
MEGVIKNFRMSKERVMRGNHMVIVVSGISNKEKAASLVGKKVVWKSPAGKELVGKIVAPHGNSGAVRAIFETGMPGQSIGTKVMID